MPYIGDFTPGKVIYHKFNTSDTGGAPIILTGTPSPGLVVYKDNSTNSTFTGLTLSVNFNSVVGFHHLAVDTNSHSTFYSTGSNFSVLVATGTVNGISVVGKEVCTFSVNNRSALRPTIADNTLEVALLNTGIASISNRLPTTLSASGYMRSDIQSVTGVSVTTTGNIQADLVTINGSAATVTALTDLVNSGYTTSTHTVNTVNTVNNLVNFTGSVGSVTGSVGSVVGTVGSVAGGMGGNVSGSVIGNVNGNVGYVVGGIGGHVSGGVIGNISGSVHSVRTNVSGNVAGSVGYVVGGLGSNVSGNVIGTVGSVVGGIGSSVSGNVVGSVGSVTGTVNSNLVAISGVAQTAWDLKTVIDNVESGLGLQGALRLILSSVAGELSGADAGSTIYIRDYNDTKNRITATVTASGNRTSITYDIT